MNLIEHIRNHKFYTGDRTDFNKVSVSEVSGSDIHQAYLARKFPEKVKAPSISQATLGSIFDVGMRQLIEDNPEWGYVNGERKHMELSNGFILSGELDHVNHDEKIIVDGKLSKLYAYSQTMKEKAHHYRLQLNYYRIMGLEDYKLALLWSLKDQSDVKKDHPSEAMVPMEVEPINKDWLINRAVEFSNELKWRLENDEPKEKCDETWGNDMRCKQYCDHAPACEYARKKGYNGVNAW